jgi:hypothetical protein
MKSHKRVQIFSVAAAVLFVSSIVYPALAAAAEPVHILFVADRTHLQPGQCAVLEWHVAGGFEVRLNGLLVKHADQKQACPAHSMVYELAVDTGVTVEFRQIAISVGGSGQAQPPAAPQPQGPAPQPQNPQQSVVIDFRADRAQLNAGVCTTLRWDVEHAKEVYLDGQGVVGHSSRKVCPAATHTYLLRVLHAAGTTDRKVTIQVGTGGAPVNPQPSGKPQADLAVTDLYADNLPQGAVWVRVTNRGPATLANVQIEMKCNAYGKPLGGQQPWSHVESPWLQGVNLKPGQTATFRTKMTVDTAKYAYDVACVASPPSNGASFSDPNWSNNKYSEAIASQPKPNPGPAPAPRNTDLAVTDLYPTKLRGGQLFARITNRGPAALANAKAQLICQGAGWKGSKPTSIQRSVSVTLNLSVGQTAAYDTGIVIDVDHYSYYEMTCRVKAGTDDPNPSNNSYSEAIP